MQQREVDCGHKLTKDNSALNANGVRDGANGFSTHEMKEVVENGSKRQVTEEKELCKSCYLKWYKEQYPESEEPEI